MRDEVGNKNISNQQLLFSSQVQHCWIKSWYLCQVQSGQRPHDTENIRMFQDVMVLQSKPKVQQLYLNTSTSALCALPPSCVHHLLFAPKHNSCAWLYCNTGIERYIDDLVMQYSWSSTSSSCAMAVPKLSMKTLLLLFVLAAGDQHLILKPKEKRGPVCCLLLVCWVTGTGTLKSWRFGQIRIHLRKQTQSPRNLLSLYMSIDPSSKGKENTHTHT